MYIFQGSSSDLELFFFPSTLNLTIAQAKLTCASTNITLLKPW